MRSFIRFAIAPWNAPASLTVRSIAVGLFCGNTVVLRGSELTPRIHYLIVRAFHEAGLPNGVLNLISTSSPNTPAIISEIIAHPQIRHVNVGASMPITLIIILRSHASSLEVAELGQSLGWKLPKH